MSLECENVRLQTLHCVEQAIEMLTINSDQLDTIITRLESAISAVSGLTENVTWKQITIQKLEAAVSVILESLESPVPILIQKSGRPKLNISFQIVEHFLSLNFKATDISRMLGVSKRTIFRRLAENGSSVRASYTDIEDETLMELVVDILRNQPNTGYKRMKGHLLHRGIKITDMRIREIMRIVDPVGVYQRTLDRNRVIRRREYFVSYSHQLWHIDGNLKLINWGFVIRGAIDGKSRTVTYLEATNNNRAETHLCSFMRAVQNYGVPLRTRSDKGGENVLIARFMIERRGTGRSSHICGRSVHNQRIERHWRDVTAGCTWIHRRLFETMQQDGILDVDNIYHLQLLHRIFLPRLNKHLEEFRNGWNSHPLSSVQNRTPHQLLWLYRMPVAYEMFNPAIQVDGEGDIEIESDSDLIQFHENNDSLVNPFIASFNPHLFQFPSDLDLDAESDCFGYDIFKRAVNFVNMAP